MTVQKWPSDDFWAWPDYFAHGETTPRVKAWVTSTARTMVLTLIALSVLYAAFRIFQQVYGFSVGLDSTTPEFDRIWMGLMEEVFTAPLHWGFVVLGWTLVALGGVVVQVLQRVMELIDKIEAESAVTTS